MIHFLVDDSAARVPEVSSDHRLVLHFPHAKGQLPAPAVRVSLMDGYKFYCSRCGWNHKIVRRALSSTIKVSLFVVALGVMFAVLVRVKSPNEGWASPIIA